MQTMIMRIVGVWSVVVLAVSVFGVDEAKPHKVNFIKEIQPILEYNCVGCHREGFAKEHGGKFQLDVKDLAFKGGREGTGITTGKPAESTV